MTRGMVKWFNHDRGYGFITPEDGGADIFVHIFAIRKSGLDLLTDKQPVQFELAQNRDGRSSAINISSI